MKAKIHSVETMGLVDGPGIRTVLFFQGCKLRCKYCHNPDTWEINKGKEMSVEEIIKMLRRYKPYYGDIGGVTCSGGEPLLQSEFLTELFKECKKEGISTCIDTAGYGNGNYNELLSYTDLVIMDLKHIECDKYNYITCGNISKANEFLEAIKNNNIPIWIRHVVVPDLTDSEKHIKKLGEYIKTIHNVKKVELLPYHILGVEKYKTMNIQYSLEGVLPMDKEKTENLQKIILDIVFG